MRQFIRSIVLQTCRLVRRKYFGLIFFCGLAFFCANRYGPHRETRYYYMFNEGCKIPFMEIYDEEFEKIDYDPNFLITKCSNFTLLLNNNSVIWVDEAVFHKYNITVKSISCCYQPFERSNAVENINAPEVNRKVHYKPCRNFTEYVQVFDEFVKVSCSYEQNNTRQNYTQFFIFPFPRKEDQKLSSGFGYNVIILGFSGMSRMNFYRSMPTTFDYLASKGSVELQGYHKIGGNTFVNMMPLLLGLKDKEMKRTCWPHLQAYFDNCPFIWTLYKHAKYYTALGDDCSYLSLFNFLSHGFLRTPTDYYLYPFIREVTALNGKEITQCNYCLGNKFMYQVLLDYIANLTSTLKHSKLFGFFWETCMSHEFHALPELMDSSYLELLKKMEDSGYLENTILVIISNSGMRWGEIRLSVRGRTEERLPVMQMLLPMSFRKKYRLAYENLIVNMYRLTTPFDVYATLKDLVNLSIIEDSNIKLRTAASYANDRSISLFLPVPENRTCAHVGIKDHECICDRMGQRIKPNCTIAHHAAVFLVEHLNDLMRGYDFCATLKVKKILQVSKFVKKSSKQYNIVVILVPESIAVDKMSNYVEVEATLSLEDGVKWLLEGDIYRTNALGYESRCLPRSHQFHELCYCYPIIFRR